MSELYVTSYEEKALRHFMTDSVAPILWEHSTRSLVRSGYLLTLAPGKFSVTDEGRTVLRKLQALDLLLLRCLDKEEAFSILWDRGVVAHRLMEMYHRGLTAVHGPKVTSGWCITDKGRAELVGAPETTTEIVAFAFGWGPVRYDREDVL